MLCCGIASACNTDLSGMWEAVPGWTSTNRGPCPLVQAKRHLYLPAATLPLPLLREASHSLAQGKSMTMHSNGEKNISVFLPRTMAVNKHGTGAKRSELQRLRGEGRVRRGGTGVLEAGEGGRRGGRLCLHLQHYPFSRGIFPGK